MVRQKEDQVPGEPDMLKTLPDDSESIRDGLFSRAEAHGNETGGRLTHDRTGTGHDAAQWVPCIATRP